MTGRIMILTASLALVAGCHARKETTQARADSQKEEKAATATHDHETVGEFGEKVADNTAETADATVDEAERVGENVAETTRDAGDDTLREADRAEEKLLGENETLPPERGEDTPENGEETPDPGSDDEDVVATMPAETFGTEVTARVAVVDRKKKRVAFRILEGVDEISLQSGKEILVPFMDLELLTGMPKDEAIEALQKSGDVQVRVFGKGDSMRILEIDVGDDDEK